MALDAEAGAHANEVALNMRMGYVNLFCPICGSVFRYGVTKGTYHSKEWGHLCSKECYQTGEMKYARMSLGKDDV